MAVSMLVRRHCSLVPCLIVAKRQYASSPPSLFSKVFIQLNQRFLEVEHFIRLGSWFKNRHVRRKNMFYDYAQKKYGVNVAAAYSILKLGGGFRFAGQTEWIRTDSKGKFGFDFVNTPDSTIEEIDLSRTLINQAGLHNLSKAVVKPNASNVEGVSQRKLRSLFVQGCPEVDDWFLARLHVFSETLQELNLSHCPRITVGGLAALQHLRQLQQLDISSLPQVQSPGLVQILIEEMLPHCKVIGAEYDQGLQIQKDNQEPTDADSMRHTWT